MILNKKMVEDSQLLLGLHGQALSDTAVNTAYRTLAKSVHPDVGGDAAQFAAIDRAKCILLEFIKRQPIAAPDYVKENCPNCRGRGSIKIRRHFGSLTVVCGRCKGSGDAAWDADTAET